MPIAYLFIREMHTSAKWQSFIYLCANKAHNVRGAMSLPFMETGNEMECKNIHCVCSLPIFFSLAHYKNNIDWRSLDTRPSLMQIDCSLKAKWCRRVRMSWLLISNRTSLNDNFSYRQERDGDRGIARVNIKASGDWRSLLTGRRQSN